MTGSMSRSSAASSSASSSRSMPSSGIASTSMSSMSKSKMSMSLSASSSEFTSSSRSSRTSMSNNGSSNGGDVVEFDYVIVGAGPSAMGLLFGLLETFKQQIDSNSSHKNGNGDALPFSVAIVERGPLQDGDEVEDSAAAASADLNRWFEASHDPSSPFVSVLQASLVRSINEDSGASPLRRTVDVPIGKGVGGGSNINAGLCMAPCQSDFDAWPEPWKSQMMNSVRELQHHLVENKCMWNALNGERIYGMDCLKEANPKPEIVVPSLAKFNSQNGHLERANYYQALLKPLFCNNVLSKSSTQQSTNANNSHPALGNALYWLCNREAQRLVMDDNQVVTAVEVLDHATGMFTTLGARKEVILCAGALETPALLLVSGIGPASNICSHDDNLAADEKIRELPGVGENMRDHVILPRVFWGAPPSSTLVVNGIHRTMPFSVQDDNYLLMVSTTTPEIALHFALRILQQHHDKLVSWWLSFWPFNRNPFYLEWITHVLWQIAERLLDFLVLRTPIFWLLKYGLTTLNLALVNPQSVGRLCLEAKMRPSRRGPWRREDVKIHLDLGYLDCAQDIAALWKGWVASAALCPDLLPSRKEVFPGAFFRFVYGCFGGLKTFSNGGNAKDDNEKQQQQHNHPRWFSPFALDACLPFFHWSGTCSMQTTTSADNDKSENSWVVDSNLRVQGIEKLRICDASVFPNNLSVPPALACAAMGHLFGKKLLLQGGETGNIT